MGHTTILTSTILADPNDPLAIFTTPPPNESPEQRVKRELIEAEERRISDKIDEQIKAERALQKKRDRDVVKVLLLGQAESGKSTTLKNFRMKYARAAWKQERASWRAVVQLNLVRSILSVIEALQLHTSPIIITDGTNSGAGTGPNPTPLGSPIERPANTLDVISQESRPAASSQHALSKPKSWTTPTGDDADDDEEESTMVDSDVQSTLTSGPRAKYPQLTDSQKQLIVRLGPLRKVEADLKRHLGAAAEEITDDSTDPMHPTPFESAEQDASASGSNSSVAKEIVERRRREFMVRCWPSLRGKEDGGGDEEPSAVKGEENRFGRGVMIADLKEATEIISSCREDMKALWRDLTVKDLVKRRKVKLQDGTGFFLEDLDRIAQHDYEPTDDDVIRCRLRTTGVQEYQIKFDGENSGAEFGKEWIMYDVGGARTHRYAWLPFFENINAIIFLAPISCFDERLLEDSRINRLEDSFILWKAIVSSKLLPKTTMIVFMNKCDILKRKLEVDRIMVNKYLPSFGERKNDVPTAVKYLRDKFKEMSKQFSPEPRANYLYSTSVIDTKATSTTLKSVRDGILREHLISADFV